MHPRDDDARAGPSRAIEEEDRRERTLTPVAAVQQVGAADWVRLTPTIRLLDGSLGANLALLLRLAGVRQVDGLLLVASLTLCLRLAPVHQADAAGWVMLTRLHPRLLLDGWRHGGRIGGLVGVGVWGMYVGSEEF